MLIIKVLLIAVFSLSMTNFVAAETDNSNALAKKEEQQMQTSKSASSTTDNNAVSSQQVEEEEKKPNMADYCRKYTC